VLVITTALVVLYAFVTTRTVIGHTLSQPAARGSDVNPMSDSDLEAKLRSAAAG
jgi:hypothetical protein